MTRRRRWFARPDNYCATGCCCRAAVDSVCNRKTPPNMHTRTRTKRQPPPLSAHSFIIEASRVSRRRQHTSLCISLRLSRVRIHVYIIHRSDIDFSPEHIAPNTNIISPFVSGYARDIIHYGIHCCRHVSTRIPCITCIRYRIAREKEHARIGGNGRLIGGGGGGWRSACVGVYIYRLLGEIHVAISR